MAISSINTNLAALLAQSNIGTATTATSNAVGALSSGNRIVNASTDVAALATGTALQSQVNVLNVALTVASQGSSLLQVADGALAQIQGILQRQQAITVSAQSGSVSSTQRGFLNQEFSALTDQINQLAATTNFNGVNLLDGSISGSTAITTNSTAGSTQTPPSARIATVGTVTGLAGDTLSLAISGQPTVTFTFGTAASQIKVGTTVNETAANIASALNNSGLSQLSNFRFEASGADVKAYYNGSAKTTSNIPTVTSSSSDGVTLSNTGTAAFSSASSILGLTGKTGVGDVITVGSHSFTVAANGSAPLYTISGAGGTVDVGTDSTTAGLTSTETLQNLAAALNASAGATNFEDLANITFTVDTTTASNPKLVATYSGSSATPPTISTSYTAVTAGTLAGSTGNTINAGLSVLTAANIVDFVTGAVGGTGSSFQIGGQTINFAANGTNVTDKYLIVSGSTGTVDLGTGGSALADTLTNIAAYLNNATVNAGLGGGLAGMEFGSDGTNVYVSNTKSTNADVGSISTVFSNGVTAGNLGSTGASIAASGTQVVVDLTGGNLNVGNTITTNSVALTIVTSGGGTAGSGLINRGATTSDTLDNIVSYLNANKTALGIDTNFTASKVGNTVIFTNGDTSAHSSLNYTLGAGQPQDVVDVTNATALAASVVGTFSGSIHAGDTIQVGSVYFSIAANGTTQAGGQTGAVGNPYQINLATTPTLSNTLTSLVNYLNTRSTDASTAVNPAIANTTFSTNGTQIFAQKTSATATGSFNIAYTAASSPTATIVTGANLSEISAKGIGAGITSSVGKPTGSLFVTSTGTGSVTNYGSAVDLSNISNNASFVGKFGGTGSIGAITATYVNTGDNSTSGVQFSVKVGNDTYTTNTITNTLLTSTTAPVSLTFNGSNNITTAAEGGSFTLTLQPQSAINNQISADQLATGINAALADVSAYQNRSVLSYNNNYSATVGGIQTATLAGSSLTLNSSNFASASITSVTVTAPTTGTTDAKITAIVNGSNFTTISGIGSTFAANNQIVLINAANPSETLTLTLGSAGSADLSSTSNASAFQTALSSALGLDKISSGLSFQIGASSNDTIGVTLGAATTSTLFKGVSQNVLTQADAAVAGNAVTDALNQVTALRATVGALEERFTFASSAIQNAVQNQGAAKSNLLDTDVAATSTAFATAQVQLQAGIAVLAQANQLQQNLLKLIG